MTQVHQERVRYDPSEEVMNRLASAPTAHEGSVQLGEWTAADVMSAPVVTVPVGTRVWSAWTALVQSGRRHLVVMDERRFVGVIDDRRMVLQWPMGALRGTELTVGDVVRRGTSSVHEGTPVSAIARLMLDEGTDAVPVATTSGAIVGLVTGSDLIALLGRGRPEQP